MRPWKNLTGVFLLAISLTCISHRAYAAQPTTEPAPLALYDDFTNTSTSESLWLKDLAGSAMITLDSGKAVIDMSAPTPDKHARLVFPFAVTLNRLGGTLEIAWDQQIVTDGANGFGTGFSLTSGENHLATGGQVGAASGGAVPRPHCFIIVASGISTFSKADGGVEKHHFMYTITHAKSILKVYRYNPDFDAAPDRYATAGELIETLETAEGQTVPADDNLRMLFTCDTPLGDDPYASFNVRSAISVEHVWTNIPKSARIDFTPGPDARLKQRVLDQAAKTMSSIDDALANLGNQYPALSDVKKAAISSKPVFDKSTGLSLPLSAKLSYANGDSKIVLATPDGQTPVHFDIPQGGLWLRVYLYQGTGAGDDDLKGGTAAAYPLGISFMGDQLYLAYQVQTDQPDPDLNAAIEAIMKTNADQLQKQLSELK